jgi:hypothetical protein
MEVVETSTLDVQGVVWWALVVGGAIGGFARCLVNIKIVLPYWYRDAVTGGFIVIPGSPSEVLLGPIAALVLQGAGAATFTLQTEFDARGFWGPLLLSIPVGILAGEFLNQRARITLQESERRLLDAAEESVQN